MTSFVFHDPSGRRARRAGLGTGLLLAALALVIAGFAATLALAPRVPAVDLKDPRILSALHVENAHHVRGWKPAWTKVRRRRVAANSNALKPLTVAFYVSWDERSRTSLAAHIGQIDVVAPMWVTLKDTRGGLDLVDDPQATAILAQAKHKPSILPVVSNVHNDVWDQSLGDGLLLNAAGRARLVANLVQLAKDHGYAGFVFDLENLSPAAQAQYPALVAQANAALNIIGRETWATAPFADEAFPVQKLSDAADTVVLMAYDQHWGTGDPGPIAAQDWFEKQIDHWLSILPAHKTIVALGSYGYDWAEPAKGQPASSETLTFHEATQLAHDSGVQANMDDDALNATFGYQDDAGRKHSVWFLDAPSMYNQIKVTDDYRPRGYGLWRLGAEDPDIWRVLPHAYDKVSAQGLETLEPAQDVDFDGSGEVLHVVATPQPGRRSFSWDPDTGLIADENYDVTPTAYVIQRYGAKPGVAALTFDDGPDARWTPKLLKILRDKHAPATFFVIGKNMQHSPWLVQRELAWGNEVGSHTYTHPNIAATPVAETDIELNATQRLFEVITGHSLRLFRPPYFGDAEPSTPAEVEPLITAQKLGYLIVGLRIDPDDWKKPDARLIVSRTLDQLHHPRGDLPGQVILLHDSGGDRSRTVAALPHLIDALRAQGYRLVTIGELAGLPVGQANPTSTVDPVELTLDRAGFFIIEGATALLQGLFIIAIVLGMARLLFLAILALVHWVRFGKRQPARLDPQTGPMVTVLVPCFNEEKVIAASVRRILASKWSRLEVLVLDDGSTDQTAAEVTRQFAGHPQVQLLSFANAGKAAALNRGLAASSGEIVVALDADTHFTDETIGLLVRWFRDPKVGAVAGNALVGNRLNVITRWQALEYVTAQNLERRALAALGAVTVVPGAVGAWRRSALEELGGYPGDTLAEDQDLTLAVQRAGWKVEFDPRARAYTEAPDTLGGLLRQRFRWSFGTLQCIFKHRRGLFSLKRPILGFVALPQIWLFQIILTVAAPLVDLAVLWALISAGLDRMFHPVEWSSDNLVRSLLYWLVFVLVDLSAAALGMGLERRAPWSDLLWLPVQRFGYRQLMYYVVIKAVFTAVKGPIVGWGKLERRATVAMAEHG